MALPFVASWYTGLRRSSIGVKIAVSSIAVMIAVLGVSLGAVSRQIWRDADQHGDDALLEAATSTSELLRAYEQSARRAVLKDLGLFKRDLQRQSLVGFSEQSDAARQIIQAYHDGKSLNDTVEIIDGFSSATGAVATLFARRGSDFVRVSTSLRKEDGSRAVGTLLDHTNPAYEKALSGLAFDGRAELFGRSFGTHYEPVLHDGKVIGILFVGTDLTDILKSAKEAMQTRKPFGSGAVYAVDVGVGASYGTLLGLDSGGRYPSKMEVQAGASTEAWARILASKASGTAEVDWSPMITNGRSGDARRVAFVRNEAWNWIVISDAPQTAVMAHAKRILIILWGATAAAIATLMALIILLSSRLVTQRVNALISSLNRLAEGNISGIFSIEGQDEVGRLTAVMEKFRLRLVQTLSTVQRNAHCIAAASAQMAQDNVDLSARTEEQAGDLQQTSATMEQLGAAVRSNAHNAMESLQHAKAAALVAVQGGEAFNEVVSTMHGINESSQKIGEIIGVIDGIAFQTNILALNAAVEAARAGVHGRGFGVVAAEVRGLAQRSAAAAKEIKDLITRNVNQVEQGNLLVDRASSRMIQIVNSIERVSAIMTGISSAVAEESEGILQVGEAVIRLDNATKQNAAMVEQSAAAAGSLEKQAEQLVQSVAFFKLSS